MAAGHLPADDGQHFLQWLSPLVRADRLAQNAALIRSSHDGGGGKVGSLIERIHADRSDPC